MGVTMEITGCGFLDTAGTVRLTEGASEVDVFPDAAAWSDTSIVALVPETFTPPVTVAVTVLTSEGESNAVDLDIVAVPVFSPSNLAWGTSTALPEGLRGLRAACVPHTDSEAHLYAVGGQTGGATPVNRADCHLLGLHVSGASFTVDGSWTPVSALPAARAFHALVAVHQGNSGVAAGTAYLFALGGQAAASDAPGGTDTVYRASVNLSDGTLGSWTAAGTLPALRWGHEAIVYRNTLFVLGGYDALGDPQDTVFEAAIQSDGTLGPFSTCATTLPQTIGSFAAVAFGGYVYVVGGESQNSTDPADASTGGEVDECYYASLRGGTLGAFSATGSVTLGKVRKKHVMWNTFGQIIVAEGVYTGGIGSTEMTSNEVEADGTLVAWNGLTGANVAGANVFCCAAAVSPISPDGGGPRFFLLGGDDFAGGASSAVYVNTAP